jgi:hypothetical protein
LLGGGPTGRVDSGRFADISSETAEYWPPNGPRWLLAALMSGKPADDPPTPPPMPTPPRAAESEAVDELGSEKCTEPAKAAGPKEATEALSGVCF